MESKDKDESLRMRMMILICAVCVYSNALIFSLDEAPMCLSGPENMALKLFSVL